MKQQTTSEVNIYLALLGTVPFLKQVDNPTLTRLAQNATKRIYNKNEMMVQRGQVIQEIFIVIEGGVEVTITNRKGKRQIITTLYQGQLFGIIPMFLEEPGMHDAHATSEVCTMFIPKKIVLECMEASPSLMMALFKVVCLRANHVFSSLAGKNLLTPAANLVNHILILATYYAPLDMNNNSEQPEIEFSQNDLAEILGISRQSLNQEIGKLEKSGLISKKYSKIKLLDPAALKKIVFDEL